MAVARAEGFPVQELVFGVDLLSEQSRLAMSSLLRTPRRAGLYVVASASLFLAEQSAELLARSWLGGSAGSGDVVVASPQGEWTVAEVVSRVVYPSQIASPAGRVVVMRGAAPASRAVHDRLLLLTEDPPEGVSVVMCVRSLSDLSRTLLGRSLASVEVAAASSGLVVEALVSRGADRGRVERASAVAGEVLPLVWASGVSQEVLDAVEVVFDADAWVPDRMDEVVAAVRSCMEAIDAVGRELDLVDVVARRLRDQARRRMGEWGVATPGWEEAYGQLAQVRELSRFGTSLPSVVAWVCLSWGSFLSLSQVPAR